MFTNNYKVYQRILFWGGELQNCAIKTDGVTTGMRVVNYSTVDASFGNIGRALSNPLIRAIPTSSIEQGAGANVYGVYFGSGTTPPTPMDYTLESPITEGLSVVGASRALGEQSEGVFAAVGTYQLMNTSDANIAISEVGAFCVGETLEKNHFYYLMEHTVLNKPTIIAPGEIKTISYRITINQTEA